jgi:hypothetical protein
MNDDWRLQVDPQDPGHGRALTERLEARELEHDLSNAFHDRVVVSRDDERISTLGAGIRSGRNGRPRTSPFPQATRPRSLSTKH